MKFTGKKERKKGTKKREKEEKKKGNGFDNILKKYLLEKKRKYINLTYKNREDLIRNYIRSIESINGYIGNTL